MFRFAYQITATKMKNFIIKLGNGSYYVKHTGDGWLETTLQISDAFRFDIETAKDYLPTLNRNAQHRYTHTNGVNKPFEIISIA